MDLKPRLLPPRRFGYARAQDVKNVVTGEFYYLSDALSGFRRDLRLSLTQSSIQFFRQGVHRSRGSSYGPYGITPRGIEGMILIAASISRIRPAD